MGYYWALSVISENSYQIHLKRNTDSYFVNNYNPAMLKAWKENLDLHPVHKQYKVPLCMASSVLYPGFFLAAR